MDAIKQVSGPCVIMAGAGTGKTTAIVNKVEYLINNNFYKPKEIVCLTFSNEAARSMESRIMLRVKERPIIGTFHAICADILKEHGHIIGIKNDFRIILPEDAVIMLHKNLKVLPRLAHEYVHSIGSIKDLGISMEDYQKFIEEESLNLPENIEKELDDAQFELRTMHLTKGKREIRALLSDKVEILGTHVKRKKFFNIWKAYEKLKAKRNLQDYSDLNVNVLKLLKLHNLGWKYGIIDEFQDTNKLQLEIIALMFPHRNITIVGDMNQSIYRFRGAYKDNIDFFTRIFQVSKDNFYTLDVSRRSPNRVLRLAHKIIVNNYSKAEDCFEVVNSDNREGEKIGIFELKNGREEVRKILEIVKRELENGVKAEEICVMFRTHQQATLLKKSLDHEGIRYKSSTRKPLLKHPILRQMINYLCLANALKNNSKTGAAAWWELMHGLVESNDEVIFGDFLRKNRDKDCISKLIIEQKDKIGLSDEGKKQLENLIIKINGIVENSNKNVIEIVQHVHDLLYSNDMEKTKEGRESLLVLERFKEIIKEQNNIEFYDLGSLIYHLDIIKVLELELEAPELEEEGIKIMTAHATKGLEYEVVIVANMAQKKFPIERMQSRGLVPAELMPEIREEINKLPRDLREEALKDYEREQQIKDERRLCYVAFTRTKQRLYLTYASDYGGKHYEPSQFLLEASYKDNNDVRFEIDNEEKYSEPVHKKNIVVNKKEPTFSPSSLKLFVDCAKSYEYKYVFNMPDADVPSWEALKLGSFVHQVIERGVKDKFSTEEVFFTYAKAEALKPEWEGLELNEALLLIKVFFERNKGKYNQDSRTEENLHHKIDGIKFFGVADRIDFHPDGLEIIDYKTGYANVPPKQRDWQLGYYALACAKFGKVKRVTLDMLRHERPLEFDIQDGIAKERNTGRMSFSLEQVREELVNTAKQILESYKSGFKPCPIEKNCDFCNEHVWKL